MYTPYEIVKPQPYGEEELHAKGHRFVPRAEYSVIEPNGETWQKYHCVACGCQATLEGANNEPMVNLKLSGRAEKGCR